MSTHSGRVGLYASYNERKNGPFDEAVLISTQPGGLIWLDKARREPDLLNCPTEIFIRLSGQERYFRGILFDIRLAGNLPSTFALQQAQHRPSAWRAADLKSCPVPCKDFKSVLYIKSLKEVQRPPEIDDLPPPQGPVYVDL